MAQELITDIILKSRHFLDEFAEDLTYELSQELIKAQKQILNKLTDFSGNELTKSHYQSVLAETNTALRQAYPKMEECVLDGMSEAAQLEYFQITNAIHTQAGLKLLRQNAPNMGLPAKALKSILKAPVGGTLLHDWVNKNHSDTSFRIRSALSQGLIQGQGMYTIAREIKKKTNMGIRESRTLTRTAIMDASNKSLLEVYSENAKYIRGYRWLATLDHRTCPGCGHYDGQFHQEISGFSVTPLLHALCRCVIVCITIFEDKTIERPAKVWDLDKKKYVYEKVSTKETYEEWFSRQDAGFQRKVLGPKRYDLFKTGKLQFKDFTDTRGLRLNLEQLKKRYGIKVKKKK